ncbi:polysaccharide deacetylase family protein [Jeotgalibacillus proteolyticus]|uniref:NodB homology domain-containing protein n=1 Tax=Jeotgalibacillus proteolyticus TaxID=2082395 RepID=A0A2S5GBV8_9BACL|nr:polysaccharide deacetylase family protein [Jeotgalibacillus proteolyticus]PPA70401.1 hypothetical protein C4B60_12565 [Jeotgalibacillus proteolyticus]
MVYFYRQTKVAYLTFDDGPSDNTLKILDILDTYNVKATFFVIGNVSEKNQALYWEIVRRGHSIGLHTYTHDYSYIYSSLENFKEDLTMLENTLMYYIGFVPSIYRFPGGSTNQISQKYGPPDIMEVLKKEVLRRGYIFYDWNVDSGDTAAALVEPDIITNNVLTGAANKSNINILLHDAPAKTTTVEALPGIITGLTAQGFTFRRLP